MVVGERIDRATENEDTKMKTKLIYEVRTSLNGRLTLLGSVEAGSLDQAYVRAMAKWRKYCPLMIDRAK